VVLVAGCGPPDGDAKIMPTGTYEDKVSFLKNILIYIFEEPNASRIYEKETVFLQLFGFGTQ